MVQIAGLETGKLVKTGIVFGLEDVLVPGKIDAQVDSMAVREILANLQKLEQGVPGFHFFLATGHRKEKAFSLLERHKLKPFFSPDKVFFVSLEYLASKQAVDRELYEKNLKENPDFKDEYFKQVVIDTASEKFAIPKEKMVLVCHDLWFAGFYTLRFSKIDFALIRSALSNRHQKHVEIIKGLTYINRAWPDIRKLLLGEFPPANYVFFEQFVQGVFKKELIGDKTLSAIVQAKARTMGGEGK